MYLCTIELNDMAVYTIESRPEDKDNSKYVSIRCPHIGINGYVCERQLIRFIKGSDAEFEIKCPKCKSVIRVSIRK